MTSPRQPFTGRARNIKTRRTVYAGEVLSRLFITVGGIGTIVAVLTIGVFLIWVVFPLFLPATVDKVEEVPAGRLPWQASETPVYLAIDEDQVMGWALFADGAIQAFRLDNGKALGPRRRLVEDGQLTAWSGPGKNDDWVFGFADGTVRLATIDWDTPFLEPKDQPPELRDLPQDGIGEFEDSLVRRAPDGRLRRLRIKTDVKEPVALSADAPSAVRRLDHVGISDEQATLCVVTDGQPPRIVQVSKALDWTATLGAPFPAPPHQGLPDRVLLNGTGDNAYLLWNDGMLCRYNTASPDKPILAETVRLGDGVTAAEFLIGKTTVVAGDSTGRLRAWFSTRPPGAETVDRVIFQAAHDLPGPGQAATALAPSTRTLQLAAGYADGKVRVYYVTSEKLLAELDTTSSSPVRRLAAAPRNDGVAVLTDRGLWHWRLKPGHPEATPRALFLPVWYEDYPRPETVWQSTGVEPKLGLWPLIFGTLKATLYSLLIGVPLALLAAVYSSEFLHPRAKNVVKPAIELMASLPSVVLGFLAALIFAPVIDRLLPAFLALFVTVPVAFLLGAYFWQLLPEKLGLRLARWRILFIALAMPAGLAAAVVVGPAVQRLLFAGDLKHWLSQPAFGSGANGWLVLLLPWSALAVAIFMGRMVNPWVRRRTALWSRGACAVLDLGKFLLGAAATVLMAWLAGFCLNGVGYDPRGSLPVTGPLVSAYSPLNSLIVGFVMGFAIIPIIYTIADDALSAVPEHLRAASLGCGATPWQTATRIIIPTAMSGLFSAVMIGLGRAVGETMIVLMAAGATPLKDWNVFNGFRSLSACIAIEMPESVRGSTHYRTLYLAGLVLFAITFVLNTVAEMVRLRFRKRAYQL